MSKIKWLLAFILAIAGVTIARATLFNEVYLPLVLDQPTLTPTRTRTPTPTPVPSGVYIVRVEYKPDYNELNEYVEIKNNSNTDVDMTGWRLRDENLPNTEWYYFPKFTLRKYSTVKVWTKIGNDTSSNLYWNRTKPVWDNGGDCAYLHKPVDGKWERVHAICFP